MPRAGHLPSDSTMMRLEPVLSLLRAAGLAATDALAGDFSDPLEFDNEYAAKELLINRLIPELPEHSESQAIARLWRRALPAVCGDGKTSPSQLLSATLIADLMLRIADLDGTALKSASVSEDSNKQGAGEEAEADADAIADQTGNDASRSQALTTNWTSQCARAVDLFRNIWKLAYSGMTDLPDRQSASLCLARRESAVCSVNHLLARIDTETSDLLRQTHLLLDLLGSVYPDVSLMFQAQAGTCRIRAAGPPFEFLALPRDLQRLILSLLLRRERRRILPLVCNDFRILVRTGVGGYARPFLIANVCSQQLVCPELVSEGDSSAFSCAAGMSQSIPGLPERSFVDTTFPMVNGTVHPVRPDAKSEDRSYVVRWTPSAQAWSPVHQQDQPTKQLLWLSRGRRGSYNEAQTFVFVCNDEVNSGRWFVLSPGGLLENYSQTIKFPFAPVCDFGSTLYSAVAKDGSHMFWASPESQGSQQISFSNSNGLDELGELPTGWRNLQAANLSWKNGGYLPLRFEQCSLIQGSSLGYPWLVRVIASHKHFLVGLCRFVVLGVETLSLVKFTTSQEGAGRSSTRLIAHRDLDLRLCRVVTSCESQDSTASVDSRFGVGSIMPEAAPQVNANGANRASLLSFESRTIMRSHNYMRSVHTDGFMKDSLCLSDFDDSPLNAWDLEFANGWRLAFQSPCLHLTPSCARRETTCLPIYFWSPHDFGTLDVVWPELRRQKDLLPERVLSIFTARVSTSKPQNIMISPSFIGRLQLIEGEPVSDRTMRFLAAPTLKRIRLLCANVLGNTLNACEFNGVAVAVTKTVVCLARTDGAIHLINTRYLAHQFMDKTAALDNASSLMSTTSFAAPRGLTLRILGHDEQPEECAVTSMSALPGFQSIAVTRPCTSCAIEIWGWITGELIQRVALPELSTDAPPVPRLQVDSGSLALLTDYIGRCAFDKDEDINAKISLERRLASLIMPSKSSVTGLEIASVVIDRLGLKIVCIDKISATVFSFFGPRVLPPSKE